MDGISDSWHQFLGQRARAHVGGACVPTSPQAGLLPPLRRAVGDVHYLLLQHAHGHDGEKYPSVQPLCVDGGAVAGFLLHGRRHPSLL